MLGSAFRAGLTLSAILVMTAPAFAAGDAAAGQKVFSGVCAMCHNNAKGAGNKIGPNLFDVAGRKAGSVAGFNYSAAMKNAGFVWTEDKLAAYLNAPAQTVPGNKMPYAGTHDPVKAANLAAYLATLK